MSVPLPEDQHLKRDDMSRLSAAIDALYCIEQVFVQRSMDVQWTDMYREESRLKGEKVAKRQRQLRQLRAVLEADNDIRENESFIGDPR